MVPWALPELVCAARNGKRADLDALIEAVWPGCYRLAAAILGDAALAQDVAQESCVLIHRRIVLLRDCAAFDAWLYKIVVREASRLRRKHRAAPAVPPPVRADADVGTMAIDVWRALGSLPPALREVVVLRYFEDLNSRDIARVLGVPSPTVRFRLMQARRRLRPFLAEYECFSPVSETEVHHAI